MTILAGIDIGGTKCAVCVANVYDQGIELLGKRRFSTPASPVLALGEIIAALRDLQAGLAPLSIAAIGISCGGPLDSQRGLVLSPPNLINWRRVDVLSPLTDQFGVPAGLQNDANACALAEWKWGAGRGCRNMIFLTFGTGMGAGLILDGKLYSGTNDMAGEVGHIRLEKDGPIGHRKSGSFEGFCSGGGIGQLARALAKEKIHAGQPPTFCAKLEDLPAVTAEKVGQAAQNGDPLAREVFEIVGRQLGYGLAILVDILNPERIVIGSIYNRQRTLLEPITMQVLRKEALPASLAVCEIVPAGLGESIGDFASLSVAIEALNASRLLS